MYFHYTSVMHLPFILESDRLVPSRRQAHGDHRFGLLWFSANTKIEPTAWKSDVAVARLGSNEHRIRPWREVARRAGFSSAVIRRLEASGRKTGAVPGEWFAAKAALPIREMSLEVLLNGRWEPIAWEEMESERVGGAEIALFGPGGLVAVVQRTRSGEGYWCYATNRALYSPGHLVAGGRRLSGVG